MVRSYTIVHFELNSIGTYVYVYYDLYIMYIYIVYTIYDRIVYRTCICHIILINITIDTLEINSKYSGNSCHTNVITYV